MSQGAVTINRSASHFPDTAEGGGPWKIHSLGSREFGPGVWIPGSPPSGGFLE